MPTMPAVRLARQAAPRSCGFERTSTMLAR
jgi:hypothetical protein